MGIQITEAVDAASLAKFDAIIDVRSPGEFAEDHVPGAENLPVLDDAQRAQVGTIYVQESRFLARRIGAAHVARNIALHLETANLRQEDVVGTRVRFRSLSQGEINGYLATGEPLGKAGGYGIQGYGALLVSGIEGCFYNVVGLPLARLGEMLKSFGVDLMCPPPNIT